jgi:hypothetical protein
LSGHEFCDFRLQSSWLITSRSYHGKIDMEVTSFG